MGQDVDNGLGNFSVQEEVEKKHIAGRLAMSRFQVPLWKVT